jgi:hypothetical protein
MKIDSHVMKRKGWHAKYFKPSYVKDTMYITLIFVYFLVVLGALNL